MILNKVYFIHKDFTGFPIGLFRAYYDEDGELVVGDHHSISRNYSKVKNKFTNFKTLEEILEYRICKCGKENCLVNKELYKIVNEKIKEKENNI